MIKDIAKFLELDRNDEEIAKVVEATSFQTMHSRLKELGLTRKGIVTIEHYVKFF